VSASEELRIAVPAEAAGLRLDRFVTDYLAEQDDQTLVLSRSRVQKLIAAEQLLLDGRAARSGVKLEGGEWLTVRVPEPETLDLVPEQMALEVLFEDSDVIAVNKPAGLVVHPGAGIDSGTLVHGLLAHCKDLSGIGGARRPGIVHRLDRGTSGVIIAAKNDRAHEGLSLAFAERRIAKRYAAFTIGVPKPERDTIDTPYGRHPTDRKRFSSRVESERRAVTSYEIVHAAGGLARLAVVLGTGRTHQIRVHLADRGHPLAGDVLYGVEQLPKIIVPPVRKVVEGLMRQALHAASLELAHPVSGAPLKLEAPLPPDLAALEEAMRAVR
jgi:23S rRNA pseudouridine1911/1915/1917 synthase